MTLHSLPLFIRLVDRPVMLLGAGETADAKRRLLERAGALVVGEETAAALAIVALDDPDAAVARLKARGVLVNAVDRPDLCDFTLPAIVDRDPVIVAIGTGGVSAGLAAALRQRLEVMLPAGLGRLAERLHAARDAMRARHPDAVERRRAIAAMLAVGGPLDPLRHSEPDLVPTEELGAMPLPGDGRRRILLASPDPDDLTLRQARALADAGRLYHAPDVPSAILDRTRADAPRIACAAPPDALELGDVDVRMA